MSRYYILEGGVPVEVLPMTWAQWWELHGPHAENSPCRIAQTYVTADVMVSTVFLGLDHQWTEGRPPMIYETMIFGGPHDDSQWRYSTREQAESGHSAAVTLAREQEPGRA